MNNNYGTVDFEGKTLTIIEEAHPDNYKDYIRYYAYAVDSDGTKYVVEWDTTKEWDLAQELYTLQNNDYRTEEENERLEELQEMVLVDVEDGSNACDWDNPMKITEV